MTEEKRGGDRKLLLRFSLISALFFAAFASTSYQSVFLMEKGFTSAQIGLGTSIGGVVGLIVLPIWGAISDRLGSAKAVFILGMIANGILYMAFPAVVRATIVYVWPIYLYLAFTTLFRQPANAMLDSWAVSELSPRGINYGSARMWGSIGYSVVSLALGATIGKVFSTQAAFYIMLAFIVPLVILCIFQPATVRERGERNKPDFRPLVKNRRFLVYILYTIGLNIYLSVTIIFMGYILERAGCEKSLLGVVTGFRALMEIISMSFSGVLRKKWPMGMILLLSGVMFGTEHLLYAHCGGLYALLGVMVLSGLAGGIFYSMGPSYIHEIVAPEVRNTAQSISGMSMAFTGIIGNFFGGKIIARFGISALTTGCGCLILALTAIFGASQLIRRQKKAV